MDYNKAALEMHETHKGKVGIVSKVEVATRDDLSTAYTPGVAEPCRKIKENPEDVYKYTFKGNMVAVVSNGTAVLGLGDIGPEAGLPVMEGKAVLFKEFGGVDAFPICIDAHDAASVIAACKAIAPTFGGINLEDIKSPECFEIEETLERELDIPVFHGLMRVRCFTQDDAHIFMMPNQIEDVIQETIRLFDEVYATFGLTYHAELSTRPDNSMGDDATWEMTTNALRKAMDDFGLKYVVNEGDGAFYGPKIDFHLKDSIGRTWQCGTIQLDMLLPEKFNLTYTGEDGQKHRPVMIHRVVYGSIERFIGILIENYAGAFPAWLAPEQVRVMPITDKFNEYAKSVVDKMEALGIRAHLDDRNEKIGYKIREGQVKKVPYMLVVGEKEATNGTVSVRSRSEGEMGAMAVDEFIAKLQKEIKEKK